jgi:hypothetical protein
MQNHAMDQPNVVGIDASRINYESLALIIFRLAQDRAKMALTASTTVAVDSCSLPLIEQQMQPLLSSTI